MIRQSNSLATANAVVSLLNSGDKVSRLKKDWWIESCQNGREQGLIITDMLNVAYYICEARRSDQICIYKGKYSMQFISDDAYSHPNYFGRDFDRAANWLIIELESFEEQNKQ